jgi:hypothetical protein
MAKKSSSSPPTTETLIKRWQDHQSQKTDKTNIPFILSSLSTLTPLGGNISARRNQADDDPKIIAALANFFDLVSAVAPDTSPEILAQLVEKLSVGGSVLPLQDHLSTVIRYNPFIRGGGSATSLAAQAKLIKKTFEMLPDECKIPSEKGIALAKTARKIQNFKEFFGKDVTFLRGKLTCCRVIRFAWLILVVLVPWYPPVIYATFLDDLLTMLDFIKDGESYPDKYVRIGFDREFELDRSSDLPYSNNTGALNGISLKSGFDLLKEIVLSEFRDFLGEFIPEPVENENGIFVHRIPYQTLTKFRTLQLGSDTSSKIKDEDWKMAQRFVQEVLNGGYGFWTENPKFGWWLADLRAAWLIDIVGDDDIPAFWITDIVPFSDYRIENIQMMSEKNHVHERGKWLRTLPFIHRQLLMGCEKYGAHGLDAYWRYRYSIHAVSKVREIKNSESLIRFIYLSYFNRMRDESKTRESFRQKFADRFPDYIEPEHHFLDQLAEKLANVKSHGAKNTPFKKLYNSVIVEMLIAASVQPGDEMPRREKIHSGSISSLDPNEDYTTVKKTQEAMSHALLPYKVPAHLATFTALLPDLEAVSKQWFGVGKRREALFDFFYTQTYRLQVCGSFSYPESVSMRIVVDEQEELYDEAWLFMVTGFIPATQLQSRFTAIVEVDVNATKFSNNYPNLLPSSVASLERRIGISQSSAKELSPKQDKDATYVMSMYLDNRLQKQFPDNSSTEFVSIVPLSSIVTAADKTLWNYIKSHPVTNMPTNPKEIKMTTPPQGVTEEYAKAWYSLLELNGITKWQQVGFKQPSNVGQISSHYKDFVPFERDDSGMPELDD